MRASPRHRNQIAVESAVRASRRSCPACYSMRTCPHSWTKTPRSRRQALPQLTMETSLPRSSRACVFSTSPISLLCSLASIPYMRLPVPCRYTEWARCCQGTVRSNVEIADGGGLDEIDRLLQSKARGKRRRKEGSTLAVAAAAGAALMSQDVSRYGTTPLILLHVACSTNRSTSAHSART